MNKTKKETAYYHLPGLFEFYELYRKFLALFYEHREYFYDWCEIGSIYGAPAECLWGGGRAGFGEDHAQDVLTLMQKYGISARLTFSNSLLREAHLSDKKCNALCALFENGMLDQNFSFKEKEKPDRNFSIDKGKEKLNQDFSIGEEKEKSDQNLGWKKETELLDRYSDSKQEKGLLEPELIKKQENGVIVHSDLLLEYLKRNYPKLYLVSSTTKVLTDFDALIEEVNRKDFRYVVPDFRLNKAFDRLAGMTEEQKDKVEFLVNECCYIGCTDRKKCYEAVSRKNLGERTQHICNAPEAKSGYLFSKAMKNPSFIGIEEIKNKYLPMGFSNFKIEGRSLGSALVLEFLLYYMTKPEYQLRVREEIYLDNMLDLFYKYRRE